MRFKVGGDALFVSDQYFVGDESNQAQRLASYTVFNAHASYQINKTFQIYGRVDNILDNRYATYGTFFDTGAIPNFANGGAPFTDPRSVSPARPRAFYAGLKGDLLAPTQAGTGFRQRPGRGCRVAPCGWRTERTQNASGTRG